jgi:hypothetical protein
MKTSRSSSTALRRLPWLVGGAAAAATGAAALRRRNGHREPGEPGESDQPGDRGQSGQPGRSGYRTSLPWRVYDAGAHALDRFIGWDRLPMPLGFAVLLGLRNTLRRSNLFDTGQTHGSPLSWDPAVAVQRTSDGSFNDLASPSMGMVGTRFGRNVPIEATRVEPEPALLSPNPRTVSLELLARREFIPATSVNLLAAAWIQFMVKDWFSHGQGDPQRAWEIDIDGSDPWPQRPFRILKTMVDRTRMPGDDRPETFVNIDTHWWDGSQIYGSTPDQQHERRSHDEGKLWIDSKGLLMLPDDPKRNPAMVPGWWVGLNMMATVFVREHNAVCDRLQPEYPHWSDEQLFQRARLVVSALMAKIHTVEWTPAIIAHPTTIVGLRAEWWGLAGERVRRTFGRIGNGELLTGIPGTRTNHFGVPFSLTEEFAIVYRMHPLIPDDFEFRSSRDSEELCRKQLQEISGPAAQDLTRQVDMGDLFYSFGTAHPGAIVLHNLPRGLIQFQRPGSDILMDIGATDILRAREFGVPRYNEFRRLLHMKPVRSFEELTGGDAALAEEIRRVYDGKLDRVDLMVGMFAEPRPKGFAFSDTAFRIFLLMAARRLNSDRFLTHDFNETVYTPAGMEWVQSNDMITILLRHYPELAPALHGRTNAFHPWEVAVRPAAAGAPEAAQSARPPATTRRGA